MKVPISLNQRHENLMGLLIHNYSSLLTSIKMSNTLITKSELKSSISNNYQIMTKIICDDCPILTHIPTSENNTSDYISFSVPPPRSVIVPQPSSIDVSQLFVIQLIIKYYDESEWKTYSKLLKIEKHRLQYYDGIIDLDQFKDKTPSQYLPQEIQKYVNEFNKLNTHFVFITTDYPRSCSQIISAHILEPIMIEGHWYFIDNYNKMYYNICGDICGYIGGLNHDKFIML